MNNAAFHMALNAGLSTTETAQLLAALEALTTSVRAVHADRQFRSARLEAHSFIRQLQRLAR